MYKSLVFEPDLKSYFVEQDSGNIKWIGAETVALRCLMNEGIVLPIARKLVMYARMNQGLWIDINRFLRSSFTKLAITERDIDSLLDAVPKERNKITIDDVNRLIKEIETIIGSLLPSWNKSKGVINRTLQEKEISEEKILVIYNVLKAWRELLLVLNNRLAKEGRI